MAFPHPNRDPLTLLWRALSLLVLLGLIFSAPSPGWSQDRSLRAELQDRITRIDDELRATRDTLATLRRIAADGARYVVTDHDAGDAQSLDDALRRGVAITFATRDQAIAAVTFFYLATRGEARPFDAGELADLIRRYVREDRRGDARIRLLETRISDLERRREDLQRQLAELDDRPTGTGECLRLIDVNHRVLHENRPHPAPTVNIGGAANSVQGPHGATRWSMPPGRICIGDRFQITLSVQNLEAADPRNRSRIAGVVFNRHIGGRAIERVRCSDGASDNISVSGFESGRSATCEYVVNSFATARLHPDHLFSIQASNRNTSLTMVYYYYIPD